jgi:CelD/BcsL family acetyltransferase involved in cellulose biosynthesis
LLLDPAHAARSGPAIIDYLASRAGPWDVCDLRGLPPCSPLARTDSEGDRLRAMTLEAVAPVLELPSSVDALPFSARFARRLRRAARIAGELGGARYELADLDSVHAGLERLFALHLARWRLRGEEGAFADPQVQRFHREVAGPLSSLGILRLYTLTIGGRPAAVLYALAERARTLLYLAGFEPDLEHASPGSLIVLHAIEDAIRAGKREVDFLRGSEPYKYEWGARDRPILRVRRARK